MLTLTDSEQVVRTWARANSTIRAAVSDRVFFASPQSYEKSSPSSWVTLFLVSEVHEPTDVCMQQALIQFNCWGNSKALAGVAAIAVQTAGRQLEWSGPVAVDSAVIQTAMVSQRRWLPDPTTNLARYVVDLQFLIRGAES